MYQVNQVRKMVNKTKYVMFAYAISLGLSVPMLSQAATAFDCHQAIKVGDAEKAIYLSNDLIKQDKQNREAWICQTKAFTLQEKKDEAIRSAEQVEALSKTPEEHMLSLTLLGDMEKNAEQYAKAMEHFTQSLALSKRYSNKRFERIEHDKIGDVHLLQSQAKEALEHYQQAQPLGMNNDERTDDNLRLAAAYRELKQDDLAIEYLIKSVQGLEALNDPERLAETYVSLAKAYVNKQQFASAENTLNKLMRLSQEYQNDYYQAKTLYLLSHLKQLIGDSVAQATLKQQAELLASKINASDLLASPPML